LTDRLTFFTNKPYGIWLELEHVKFALHREDCSLCPILTSIPLGGGILMCQDLSIFVLMVKLLVSYPSLNTMKTCFFAIFYKALKENL